MSELNMSSSTESETASSPSTPRARTTGVNSRDNARNPFSLSPPMRARRSHGNSNDGVRNPFSTPPRLRGRRSSPNLIEDASSSFSTSSMLRARRSGGNTTNDALNPFVTPPPLRARRTMINVADETTNQFLTPPPNVIVETPQAPLMGRVMPPTGISVLDPHWAHAAAVRMTNLAAMHRYRLNMKRVQELVNNSPPVVTRFEEVVGSAAELTIGRQEAVCTACNTLERLCDCASPVKREIAKSLQFLIEHYHPALAPQITALMLEMENAHLMNALQFPAALHEYIHQFLDALFSNMDYMERVSALRAELQIKIARVTSYFPDSLAEIVLSAGEDDVISFLHNPPMLHDAITSAVIVLRDQRAE